MMQIRFVNIWSANYICSNNTRAYIQVCMRIYIYIYIYIYMCVCFRPSIRPYWQILPHTHTHTHALSLSLSLYIYIYIYIERERERESAHVSVVRVCVCMCVCVSVCRVCVFVYVCVCLRHQTCAVVLPVLCTIWRFPPPSNTSIIYPFLSLLLTRDVKIIRVNTFWIPSQLSFSSCHLAFILELAVIMELSPRWWNDTNFYIPDQTDVLSMANIRCLKP